jgi:hypothetical protein
MLLFDQNDIFLSICAFFMCFRMQGTGEVAYQHTQEFFHAAWEGALVTPVI